MSNSNTLGNTFARAGKAAAAGLVLLAAAMFCGCSKGSAVKNADSANNGAIVCFGDSITAGRGATEGGDYPALLAQLTRREIINAGVAGNTSGEGLARLESEVLARKPFMVIVQFGGNDFLRQQSFSETSANIDQIITRVQNNGSIAVLADTGESAFMARYSSEFGRIAEKRRALFIPDVLKGIADNPALMSDEVHPNAEGYRLVANRIYAGIKSYLPEKPQTPTAAQ